MKIVIDARFLGTATGIGRYVEGLVRELGKLITPSNSPFTKGGENILTLTQGENKERVEFIVLVSKDGWEKWQPMNLENPFEPEALPQTPPALRAHKFRKKLVPARWYTLREQFALWRVLREEKPDLAHFPHWNICYFWRGPFVVTIHDLILLEYPTRRASKLSWLSYFIKYKFLFPLVLRKAIYKSKKIIVPSNYTKQSIIKYFSKASQNKIEVVYEGIPNFTKYSAKGGSAPGGESYESTDTKKPTTYNLQATSYLLYVGNALPHKNLEFLMRVFKKLKSESAYLQNPHEIRRSAPQLKLVLVGEPSYFYERLKKYARDLGMEDEVIFTGKVSDDELVTIYKNAALYVFPSLLEGFGLPPLEAMAHSVPVVAADSSCLPEILGDAAFYFDPQSEDDALEKIKQGLTDATLRAELKTKGLEQVKKYAWPENVSATLKIYKSVHK